MHAVIGEIVASREDAWSERRALRGRLEAIGRRFESTNEKANAKARGRRHELVRAGTEVTHRRESRENRRTSRTNLSIDSIFYSYYVSPSLDALMPCELSCLLCKSFLCLVLSGMRDINQYRYGFIEVAYTCHFRSIRKVRVLRHNELVCLF